MVLWWCILQGLAPPAAAQPELVVGPTECVTAQRLEETG